MAKRVTNIGIIVEYIDTSNTFRLTNAGVIVEYVDSFNYKRDTNIGTEIEYRDTLLPEMVRSNRQGNIQLNRGGRQ